MADRLTTYEVKVRTTNGLGRVNIEGDGWKIVSARTVADVHNHQRWVEVIFMREVERLVDVEDE